MAVGQFGTNLDAITYASIVPASDLLTVCDIDGDNAGTGPEDKKIAAVEFIKRSLGSADVTWMSTLAMSSLVQANDKFIVWQASTTSFKVITGSELLQFTFAGSSVANIAALTLANVEIAADYFPVWDNSGGNWKKVLASEITNKLLAYVSTAYVSTPTPITTALSGQRSTNRGASAIIEFDLPAATAGLRYSFNRIANYAVRLDPNGTEFIGDGGAGKYLEITVRGQVNIECITAGEWEVVSGSSIYSFEA